MFNLEVYVELFCVQKGLEFMDFNFFL